MLFVFLLKKTLKVQESNSQLYHKTPYRSNKAVHSLSYIGSTELIKADDSESNCQDIVKNPKSLRFTYLIGHILGLDKILQPYSHNSLYSAKVSDLALSDEVQINNSVLKTQEVWPTLQKASVITGRC